MKKIDERIQMACPKMTSWRTNEPGMQSTQKIKKLSL